MPQILEQLRQVVLQGVLAERFDFNWKLHLVPVVLEIDHVVCVSLQSKGLDFRFAFVGKLEMLGQTLKDCADHATYSLFPSMQ